jgi:hypothetical protein
MTSRRRILIALTVCTLLAIALLSQVHSIKLVSIDENFAQERISKQIGRDLPVKGPAKIAIKRVSLESASVHIADGQVNISARLKGELRFGQSFSLVSSAIGVPSYAGGAFYFHPDKIKVQELSLQGQQMRAESWMTALVETAAMHAFEKRPIYRLKDDVKGRILRSSLTSIAVAGDRIELTFSLWQITAAVAAGILLLLLSAAAALVLLVKPRLAGASPAEPAS